MASATDACDPSATITYGDQTTPGTCPQEYTISRTWIATDDCGNSTACVQTIVVEDTTPPVITCPTVVSPIECPATPSFGMATATDNCDPGVSITFNDQTTPGACPQEYSVTRTWTATDDCGNTSTCSRTIVVTDNTPPLITCPVNVTIECDESTLPTNTGMASATDACDPSATITYDDQTTPGTCPQEYTISRTWIATDDCGNSTACVQTIVVEDTTPPVITCPTVVSPIECPNTPTFGIATATDNCDPGVSITFNDQTTPGACPQEYSVTRTWTATDDCGNTSSCSRTIFVTDNTPPLITCPVNVTIECDESTLPSNTGMASATDICDPAVTLTYDDQSSPGTCPQEYTISRTWIATDDCGNSTACVQTIVVEDTTPPVITCPTVVSPIECPATPGFGMATATDNCDPGVSITFNDQTTPGACPQEYSVTRTWTATDDCGNTATCSRTIFVTDNTPPLIVCPVNVTIECTESTLPDHTGLATATDACDPEATLTYSDQTTPGACPQEYFISRTWFATDDCQNSSTCVQIIEIVDSTPPVCSAQDITIMVDPGTGYVLITPEDIDKGSFDLCGPVLLSIDQDSFTCDNEGVNIVILTVTDLCGNTSTCLSQVTVDPCFNPCVDLNAWVYIEGSITDPNGLPNDYDLPMRTSLNDLQVLPGQTLVDPFFGNKYSAPGQPYNVEPWNYPGNEGDLFDSGGDPMMGDAGYPATAVDWVLVSLRADSTGAGGPVCQAAALVHMDGYIELVEPFECCDLNLTESFYVVVEHRNHLIVMSHMKIPIVPGVDSSTITYDFRIQQSYIDDPFMFGAQGQKLIFTNSGELIYAMYAGNGEQTNGGGAYTDLEDTDINFNDRTFWEGENGTIGEYKTGDYNLNGDTNFNDRVTWERNNGIFTSVPRD
jgi:hypothetical protein